MDKLFHTIILIIGGGVAGMIAAIEAGNRGVKVLLVSKGIIGKSGTSCLATTFSYGVPYLHPDSVEQAPKDIITDENYYLNDQEITKAVLDEAQGFAQYLEKMGIVWRKLPNGSLFLAPRLARALNRDMKVMMFRMQNT